MPAALQDRRSVELPARPRRLGFARFCRDVGLDPEPFQQRIVKALRGPERELLVLLPRGNGKTTLLAAVALHHLLTEDRPAVYCGAASAAQARILFDVAARFAAAPAFAVWLEVRANEIRRADGGGHLRVIPANGPRTHGLTPSLAICDELHAHRDDALYLSLRTAMAKRPDARMVTITTAGEVGDTPLGRLRNRALAAPSVRRRGPVLEASGAGLRLLEWSLPDDGDPDDLDQAVRVNPASWITRELLADQQRGLPGGAWRSYHLNRFAEPESHWLPEGAWQAAVGEPELLPRERVYLGADIGGAESSTALAAVSERGHVAVWIWEGDEGVERAVDQALELHRAHAVVEVAGDPWRFAGMPALALERAGMTVSEFPMTDVRVCPASQRLREAITERRIVLPPDRALADQAARAVARSGRRGWRIDKPKRGNRIDGLHALLIALDRRENRPPPAQLLGWI